MNQRRIHIDADGEIFNIQSNEADGFTLEHNSIRRAFDHIEGALGHVFEKIDPDVAGRMLSGAVALQSECVRLTDENAYLTQQVIALTKQCVVLQDESDRYFDMKRKTAGSYADERVRRMTLESQLEEARSTAETWRKAAIEYGAKCLPDDAEWDALPW